MSGGWKGGGEGCFSPGEDERVFQPNIKVLSRPVSMGQAGRIFLQPVFLHQEGTRAGELTAPLCTILSHWLGMTPYTARS